MTESPSLPKWFLDGFIKYRILLIALISTFSFHASLLLAGSYRGTYDAYVHIFFGDHYARAWWNLWEPRWYTGFTVVSYPPLTHQLIAIISKFSSLPTGFVVVMITATVLNTLGIYRFSRLWVGHRPASYAALLAVFSSSIAETVHVFGQLPTMFVMGVMLNALPFLWAYLEKGRIRDLLRVWGLLMIAAAGHHVTTLFGMVFFSGPIIATVLLFKFRSPLLDEQDIIFSPLTIRAVRDMIWRRVRRTAPTLVRSGIFGVGLILILVITVLPYWLWSKSDPITQITIPHASRDSFLQNTAAGFVFFLIPWGFLSLALPYALYKGFGSRNWILASSLVALSIFGTGGTTPLPAFILKGAFYILTLDRFTFWATILILPFAGQFIESLVHGRLGLWIGAHFGAWWRVLFLTAWGAALIALALFTANLTQFRRFQPAPLDMQPIVEFLAKDNHDRWRYLTLGFGDQMAWLSAQTTAINVEGNYHSARRLPELTSTPIERLDGAKFTAIPGLGSLQQFLTTPQKYSLKYVFVNDAFYEPLLYFSGWHLLGRLENEVRVWERADVPPLPAELPGQIYPAWQRLMWGTLPVGSLGVAAAIFFITGVIFPRVRLQRWHTFYDRLCQRRRIGWIFRLIAEPADRIIRPPSDDWQYWKGFLRRISPRMKLKPIARRALYGVILLGVLGGTVGGGLLLYRRRGQTPESVILAYYDAIDFKRFTESYTYLKTALTREEYIRLLSIQGGILSSFAKLENLKVDIVPGSTADHVTAKIEAAWLTALGSYLVEEERPMALTADGWRIQLDVEAPPLPPETLIGVNQPSFYLDLPLNTLEKSALSRGVLDRPLLSVDQVRALYNPDEPIGFTPASYDASRVKGRFSGLISIVGLVSNQGNYPAQITVTAILRNKNGERLAETNVMDVMEHQLLPQEITPFRVDFFGADATALTDLSQIASAELIVRGVPTAFNLERPLAIINGNQVYNSGARRVDIPHLLFAHFDADQHLIWVDNLYLDRAISPNGALEFTTPSLPPNLELLKTPIMVTGPRLTDGVLELPSPITVHGYSR